MRAAGAVACVTKDEDFDRLVATVREGGGMKLTAENTAVVLDSTADFPEAPERFPNFRVVPLYVRFGDESFRDYVDITPGRLLRAAARRRRSCRRPRSRRRATSSRRLRGARAVVRADPLAADLLDALRHVRERPAGGGAARRRPGARDRLAHGLGVARDARDRRAAPARARHDRRGDRRVRRALRATSTSCSSRSTRSSTSRRAAASAARRRSPATS